MRFKHSRGDTIVEVLIAMTVLAAVIGGAYALSRKAMISAQQSNERIRATKIAESQLDLLKYLSDKETSKFRALVDDLVARNDTYCIESRYDIGLAATVYEVRQSGSFNPDQEVNHCWQDNLYNYYLDYELDQDLHQFKLIVEWDAFNSNTKDRVIMLYRVY